MRRYARRGRRQQRGAVLWVRVLPTPIAAERGVIGGHRPPLCLPRPPLPALDGSVRSLECAEHAAWSLEANDDQI